MKKMLRRNPSNCTITLLTGRDGSATMGKQKGGGSVEIRPVLENKRQYMDLLFLADEQVEMIERYLDKGEMFVLLDPDVVGECVVCDLGDGIFEIKNIAIRPECQGRGYGRALIEFVAERCRSRCRELWVGTGDSPMTIPFYNQCGFREHHRVPNFFVDNYDHPMWECGVQLIDMVYLSRKP